MAVPRSATRSHSRWLPDGPPPSSASETFLCHSVSDCEASADPPATAGTSEPTLVPSPDVDGDLSMDAALSGRRTTGVRCVSVGAGESRQSSKEVDGMYSKSPWRTERVWSQFDIDKTTQVPPPASYTPANEQMGICAAQNTAQPKDHLGNNSSVDKSKCKSFGRKHSRVSCRPRSRSCSAHRSSLSERWEGDGESSVAADGFAGKGASHERWTTRPTALRRNSSCTGKPAGRRYEKRRSSHRRERSTTVPTEYSEEEEASVVILGREGENSVLSLDAQKEADFPVLRQQHNTRTPSSSTALREGTALRHQLEEPRGRKQEQFQIAKEKTWIESVDNVHPATNEMTSSPSHWSGNHLGQEIWRQETPGPQNTHEAKSCFSSCVDTYPVRSVDTEHCGRPKRDAETLKSRSASFSFISNGVARSCACRSGGVSRGRPTAIVVVATAAAATAAAANFERQASEMSCRTSRLTRDFTDIVVVGKGGCGRVLKARHLLDGRVYAIKEIKFAATTRHLQSRMQLFLREVQCLRRLDCNENIVRYFSSWVEVNPLSKASVPSHEDQGSAADQPATDISCQGLEEASALEQARQEEEDPETQFTGDCCTSTNRVPYRGKGRSDECLSFYSVSHSQATRHSDRIDKWAAAQGDSQAAGVHLRGSSTDATANDGKTLQSYRSEVISPTLTSLESTRKSHEQPSPRSLNTRCHSESCEAGTSSRRPGAHDWTAASVITAERRDALERGDLRMRRYSMAKGEGQGCTASKDTCQGCFSPEETRLQSDSADGQAICRAAVKMQEEDAVTCVRSTPGGECFLFTPESGQGNDRAVSMPARPADVSESGDVIYSSAQRSFSSPVHLRLPRSANLNTGDTSESGLEEDSADCGGEQRSKESLSRVSPLHSIQSKFEVEVPCETQDEEGEFEHAAGPQGKLCQLRCGVADEAATSKKEAHSSTIPDADNQTDIHDYIEDLSPALRLALARRRLSYSSATFYVQENPFHTRAGAAPRVSPACRPSSSTSPASLCLSSFCYESCNNSDCVGDALHTGSIAGDKYGCEPCEEEPYEGGHAGRQMCVRQTSTSSSRESSQTPTCFTVEEKKFSDRISSTTHRWKYHKHSMSEAAGAAACSPRRLNSSTATTIGQETANKTCLSDRRSDMSSDAEDESAQKGETAMFHSAISVEETHDWSMSTQQDEQQRGDVLFLPVPLSELELPRQSVQDTDIIADSKKKSQHTCFERSQNSCFQGDQREDALSGASAAEEDGSHSVTPAFVALDDFWCCEDFGAQSQPGGLEIVFAEEASPSNQKDKKDQHDRHAEDVQRNDSALNETAAPATSDPRRSSSTPGLSPANALGSVVDDERNVCVGNTLALITAEQEASGQHIATIQPGDDICTNCEASAAVSPLGQTGPQLRPPLPVATSETDRPSHDVWREGIDEGNANACDAVCAAGDVEVLMRSSPAGVAAAGEGGSKESSANDKGGIRSSETHECAEQAVNGRSQAALLPVSYPAGARQPEAERVQLQEQVDQQHRWQEQQQAEQQPLHAQKPTEQQQQHQADASRAGAKAKPASATRVEVSLYIQMEYCPMSLDEYIAQTPEIDPERNEEIMAMIVNGLYSCHSAGIMHRDLKPSNIFIKGGGTVKLGDFGLAFSEDMDDDVCSTSLSAATATAKCPRDGLGGTRLHPASAFCKDSHNRLSPSLAPETPAKVPSSGTLSKQQEQLEMRSADAVVFSGSRQRKFFHAFESWPQEPAQSIKGEHIKEAALLSHRETLLHSSLRTGEFVGRTEAGISVDCAADKVDARVDMKSHVLQHEAASVSSTSAERGDEKNEETCMTEPPLKSGHSLPVFRCTTPAAPVIIRVHSEEALRHVSCAAGRRVPRKAANLDELEDFRFPRSESMYCFPSEMQHCWTASARRLLEKNCCLPSCRHSDAQRLRPDMFSCESAATSCSCPLDTAAPLLGEIKTVQTGADVSCDGTSSSRHSREGGESKQQEQSGYGKHKDEDPAASKTVQRAASKDFTEIYDTRMEMQQPTSSRSEDRDYTGKLLSKKHALRRGPSPVTGTSPTFACDKTPVSAGKPPEPMLCHSDTSNYAAGVTPSTVAHPVVVVQPPPVSSSPVLAPTKHNVYTPSSPNCLLPTRGTYTPVKAGTLYVHSAEEGDRSSGSGGNRNSSELNSGSARISSLSGSHVSPALSVLASPVFSNRTTGVGTSAYAPPEQLKGGHYDYSVDIWSLGLIAIDLFTRCETAMERAMNFRNAREGKLPPSIYLHYPWVVPFCLWCLQRDPLQRPTIKQLYTHQCLTGSVFTPRSVLSSPVPAAHAFQLPPARIMRLADVLPGTAVNGKGETEIETAADQTHFLSAASCCAARQPDSFALASTAQHKDDDTCVSAAGGRIHRQQLHILCGKCGVCVSPVTEHKRSCKASRGYQYLGTIEFGSKNTDEFHNRSYKILNQLWESEPVGDVIPGVAKAIRRGSTSPALVTSSSEHLTRFTRSTSPWRSGDEGESPLLTGNRGMMHKPVPLSALTLRAGLASDSTSPIRCSPPVSSRFPATTERLLHCGDSDEPHAVAALRSVPTQTHLSLGTFVSETQNSSRGSEDGQGREILREKLPQLRTKHRTHLPPINTQAGSKESHPSENDIDLLLAMPLTNAAQTRRKRTSVENTVSTLKMSRFPVSDTDGRRASTTVDDVTAEKRSSCSPAGEEEDTASSCSEKWFAGIGKKGDWSRETYHREWTAEIIGRVTSPIEDSSMSTDTFAGTGSTFEGQCDFRRFAGEFFEHTLETNSNFYFCTQVYTDQHADKAMALVGDGTSDNACRERHATGLTKRPDQAIQREQTGGTSDTLKKEILHAPVRSLARPRRFPVALEAVRDDSSVGESCGETLINALEAEKLGQCAERTCWSQMNEFRYQPNTLQPGVAKETNGKREIEARRLTRTKSAEDFIHSAIKHYAQKMLNRYCELSSKGNRSHNGRRALPTLPPLPRPKGRGISSGIRRKSDLFESNTHCSAVEDVRAPGEVKQNSVGSRRQGAQQQEVQHPGHQHEDKGGHCRQKEWYSFEENAPGVPTFCGITHLRGFLPVPSRNAEQQPLVEPHPPHRRAEILVRSRRGEWKTRFAAVDKEKKLVYIFSDRNDSTKAKRVIQIEGEDGYCGVLVWEESGPPPRTKEKQSTQTSAVRKGHEELHIIPDTKAPLRRCFSDVAMQTAGLSLSPPPTTALHHSMEPCLAELLCTPPCSESPASPKDAAGGVATCPLRNHLPKNNSACPTHEEIPARALSVVALSESVSTQVSLASPSEEVPTVLCATEGTSEYSTIIEHEGMSKEDTRCCNSRSGTKAELFVCDDYPTSADGAHTEVDAERKQLHGRDAEVSEYEERKFAAHQDHLYQSAKCDSAEGDKICSYVEETGTSVQQRPGRESEHAKEGVRGDQSCVNVSEEENYSLQQRSRLREDTGCRSGWLKRSATEDVGSMTSRIYTAAMLHHLREWRARELKLDTIGNTKRRSFVKKPVACSVGRARATEQQSLPQNNGRRWLVKNDGVILGGWLARGGTSMREAGTEDSETSPTGSQEDSSPATKDELLMTTQFADTSQLLQKVSSVEVGSVCELNVLLTHNSLMDDVWIRVRMATSRSSRSTTQEEDAGKNYTAARNNNLSTDTVVVQRLGEQWSREDGAGRGENEVKDHAVEFVESLMTCFQFAEVVNKDAKRGDASVSDH